jgi:hypothetical protein
MKWPSMAVALLASIHAVQAQDRDNPATGHGYLAVCSREEEDWRIACNLYSAGMNNMLLAIDMIAGGHRLECTPGHTTLADKQRIFLAFLRANPDLQHLGSPVLYMQALSNAFPC